MVHEYHNRAGISPGQPPRYAACHTHRTQETDVGVALTKPAIDLGIVTTDGAAALKFYRDTLGFTQEPDTPFPMGGTMHRLWCGDSLIKIVVPTATPPGKPAGGGIAGATGYRYWTISVSNLNDLVAACRSGGYRVRVDATEIRPGVTIAIVEDPDGNWVEFLQTT
jgi:catechol 2,3-dioxygenase-like lactoylglutathione lyase family enzyme